MLKACAILLVFQLIGEILSLALALPVPGPVIGMALLFLALCLRGGPSSQLRGTTGTLLQHLSLLFVPAGTGVMLHVQRLADEWPAIVAALLLSTVLALIVTAAALRLLAGRRLESEV